MLTADQFVRLSPRSRGYTVYMCGVRQDEPNVPDEENPYPHGSDEAEGWDLGQLEGALEAQDGDDE